MTTRRLNYTGCQRIRRADVQISVDSTENPLRFDYLFDLAAYEFPASAQLIVEAYAHWTLMRFDCGTVANPKPVDEPVLREFATAEGLRFRLKAVGIGEQAGLILGEADQISPADITGKTVASSFLTVIPADLGDIVWRLSFSGPQPVLLINSRVGDWRSFLRRGEVRSLILPEIFRQLLDEAIRNESDVLDEEGWQKVVVELAPAGAGARPSPDDEEAVADWISESVQKFARKHHLFGGVREWLGGDA